MSQVHIVLIGPPGIGKGTQSSMLNKKRNMVHVSTGNILREHIFESTNVGLKAKGYMEGGQYVPDDVVLNLVDNFFNENKSDIALSGGMVFDGFPRTFAQAQGLTKLMGVRGLKLTLAIFLSLEHKVLLNRLTGRRCCRDCSVVSHVDNIKGTTCSSCGGELYRRHDDEEEVVQTRLDKYEDETLPLKKYYKDAGIYKDLKAHGGVEEVSKGINSLIDEFLVT